MRPETDAHGMVERLSLALLPAMYMVKFIWFVHQQWQRRKMINATRGRCFQPRTLGLSVRAPDSAVKKWKIG